MKKSRFSDRQIIKALKENENGRCIGDIIRELGISKGTFYNWRSRYGGMELSQLKRLKELESENTRLKKLYAEQALDISMLKEVLSKKW